MNKYLSLLYILCVSSVLYALQSPPGSTQMNEDPDDDGLTNFEEAEYGTETDIPDTDEDGVEDGPDGWALDAGLHPPRLSESSYAVIELNLPGYEVLDMNNSGDILLASAANRWTAGVWSGGQFTTLPQGFDWNAISDAGVVVGHTGMGYGAFYTVEVGGVPVKQYDYYLPLGEGTGSEDHSDGVGVEWFTPHTDTSGSIYSCAGGYVTLATDDRTIYSIGPLEISGGVVTELAGYMSFDDTTSSPSMDETMTEIKAANSSGILLGASLDDADQSLVVEGGSKISLSATPGSDSDSNGLDISDGISPFVIGKSGGILALWNKVDGNWERVYNPQDENSSQIGGEGYAVNSHVEMVGRFTDADGRSGPLARNGRVVEAVEITEEYVFDGYHEPHSYTINENGTFTYPGWSVAEDYTAVRPLLLLKVEFETFPDDVSGPDKAHKINLSTRQNEAAHYGDFEKFVAYVYKEGNLNLIDYLEGADDPSMRQIFEDNLRWRSNGTDVPYELNFVLEPQDNDIRFFEIEVLPKDGDQVLDRLIITVVPRSTKTAFDAWKSANQGDTGWLAELPPLYSTIEAGQDPDQNCNPSIWESVGDTDSYYHPDAHFAMSRTRNVGQVASPK